MRGLIAVAVTAVLGLTGQASAKTLVSYTREGGLAGVPLSMTVGTGGRAWARQGVNGMASRTTLSDSQLKGLRRALRRARFSSLEDSYLPQPGTVADGYTETVTYKGHRVTAGTGGDIPGRLQKLLAR